MHLPVQSGDDETLWRMRRFYSAAEFKAIVDAFRSKIPHLTLATDVIVGFPGETEQAFQRTLNILAEVKPDVTNVSKFFARPKTAAAQMRDDLVEKEEPSEEARLRRSWLSGFLWIGISVGWVGLATCCLMRKEKLRVLGWDATSPTNPSL